MKLFSLSFFASCLLLAATSARAQVTTWRAADNPHIVHGTYTVPAGQTLVLEAGAQVQIDADSTLAVEGQLLGNGTAANHVTITGAVNYSSALDVRGTLDLKFTDVKVKTVPDDNGVLLFADCAFSGNGTVFNGQVLQEANSRAPYLQLDRCAFQGDGTNQSASLYVAYCTVVIRNTSFANGAFCSVSPGYLFVDHVTSSGSTQFGINFGSDSDLFVDNVSVTGASNAGLLLSGDTRNGTNVLLGPNVTLTGNEYPVHLTIAGLYPQSAIPATGNRNNVIHATEIAGAWGRWPKFAIPYYVDAAPLTVSSLLRIDPGVIVKMAPFSYINDVGFADGMRAYGTKAQPIVFERADPTKAWYDLHSDRTEGGRMRHVIVDGSDQGVNGGAWRLENCVFRNNNVGTNGGAIVSGSQYFNNGTGHFSNGELNSAANPNSFEGNGIGVTSSDDARNAWWGSPSGPTTPRNPGGTGDRLESQVTAFDPFVRARPDYTDAPPEIHLLRPAFEQLPLSKVTLRWESSDDVGVVSHKVLFSAGGNFNGSFVEVATLPGDRRSYDWTVPDIGFQNSGPNAFIKVVAIDTTGKESFDEWEIIIPTNNIGGEVTFNIAPGQTFESGEIVAEPFVPKIEPYMTRIVANVEIIGPDMRRIYGRGMPFLSTDSARYVVAYGDTSNHQKYWYSPIFKIRPSSRVGDAPPDISLTSPQAGTSFAPGAVIPINWSASDDEGLRGFDIVGSYDGGRTWNPIARDLPADARSYNWQTAPGTGYADVRVLVIAKDWRFQTSSAGAERSFSTNSGAVEPAVQSLTLAPGRIATGETSIGTVTLAQPAPPGGTLVTISNNAQVFLDIPANITIPAGSTTGQFAINTTNVVVSGTFQVSATSGGVTKATTIVVTLKLTDLELPEEVPPSSSVTGTVALSGPAPAGGALVKLQSNDPQTASVPAEINVPEGEQTASFTANTGSVATPKSITITGEHAGTTQSVTVTVTSDAQPTPTPSATASPTPMAASQPLNIATRLRVGGGDAAGIAGFIITGDVPKRVVLRVLGPSLEHAGLANVLPDPAIELHGPAGELVGSNDNWRDNNAAAAEISERGLAPNDTLESAMIATLAPGSYTAIAHDQNGNAGTALIEVYDVEQAANARLANISTRGLVASADDVMIGGFILGATPEPARVLIRGIGPSLAASGVSSYLANPMLELRDSNGALVAANDDWKEEQRSEIESTGIPPGDELESAILRDLNPGAYTAVLAGANSATGTALIEIYNLR